MIDVGIRLPEATLAALKAVAAECDSTVGQIVREAIARDLYRRQRAKTSDRTDERLVAPLRALLADDLAYARDWPDLMRRLAVKGFLLREAGGGIVLCRSPGGQRLCKGSELGYSYSRLLARFGAPMPGTDGLPSRRNHPSPPYRIAGPAGIARPVPSGRPGD
ncbi:MAG: hypothetical protein N2422_03435 [Rhodobacteraceae bacterium]|nr:hypothetical protein [Paracoccaceae bacterium]